MKLFLIALPLLPALYSPQAIACIDLSGKYQSCKTTELEGKKCIDLEIKQTKNAEDTTYTFVDSSHDLDPVKLYLANGETEANRPEERHRYTCTDNDLIIVDEILSPAELNGKINVELKTTTLLFKKGTQLIAIQTKSYNPEQSPDLPPRRDIKKKIEYSAK